ncbi:MAG: hypothetical protein RO257_08760 [Candidatus Kapabacteria bacterium]|nr:hypothetical protein [Candidatus Kapabacteria bacterium]
MKNKKVKLGHSDGAVYTFISSKMTLVPNCYSERNEVSMTFVSCCNEIIWNQYFSQNNIVFKQFVLTVLITKFLIADNSKNIFVTAL